MMMFEVIKVLSPDGITTLQPRLATSSHMGGAMAIRTTSGQVATRGWSRNLTKELLKHSKRLPGCVWGHRGLFGTTWRRPLWWQVGTSWNNWKYLHLTWSSETGQLDITGTQYRRCARLLSTAAVPGTPTTSWRWTSAMTTARTWRGGILENLDLEFQWRRNHWRQQTIVACHRHGDHAKATISGDVFPF